MELLIVVLTLVVGLLVIDICLRVLEVTRHGFSRNAPRSDTTPQIWNNPRRKPTESKLHATQDRSSLEEPSLIVEDKRPSRFPDTRPTDQLRAYKEPNVTPSPREDPTSDAIAVPKNPPLPRRPEKLENRSFRWRVGSETVFRLQGLPIKHKGLDFDESQTRSVIGRALNVDETEVFVDSLAKLPSQPNQIATIRFSKVPSEVERNIQDHGQIDVKCRASEIAMTLDVHFESFTPLNSPPNSQFFVIALPGLGGHPFGSFKARGKNYMWFRDGLRSSLPSAHVLIYGYDSRLPDNPSFQGFQDVGTKFCHALMALFRDIVKVELMR
ncbi:hypothetical protein IWZ00DRAFT_488792 [Phyllosticta capitalensis]